MKKEVSIFAKVTILVASFFLMADAFVITPILGEIAAAFPDASASTVGLTYTLSSLCIIPAALICGKLCTVFSKKTLMIVGSLLVAVGGGLGGLNANIAYNLIMRAIEGFGAGFCITLVPTIIAELFTEEAEMTRMMGFYAAAGCVAGTICSIAAGKVATMSSWQNAYLIYLFSIVIIVMEILFLPKTPPEKVTLETEKPRMNKSTWLWTVYAFIFAVLTNCIFLKGADYILEKGVGSADTAGVFNSLITIGSFLGGLLLAWLTAKLNRFVSFFCYLLMAVAAIVIMLIDNSLTIYAGGFLFGLGYGVFFPHIYAQATSLSEPNSETHTLSIINSSYYLGMGLAAFLIEFVGKIFNNPSASFSFLFMAVSCAVLTVIYLLQGFTSVRIEGQTNNM
ncbi:bicyclomycin/multidrug efflux system [Pelotomaculum sp. FP]|uniref:MFS transporter n=1 Tax=Pelotomaculum sp. FP TaxID=261474 RepID=UPI0010654D5F|nr:MFS transporter [Pelotomaculum sp. FP]TEB18032.1 bicyclomycin/multidrug efflux system [Pelotomaculum sp. FP]